MNKQLTRMDYLVFKIKDWDLADIYELIGWINEIKSLQDTNPLIYGWNLEEAGIKTTSLPSTRIPDTVDTAYPIWAMDINGLCLVGAGMDDIEQIGEIEDHYREKREGAD